MSQALVDFAWEHCYGQPEAAREAGQELARAGNGHEALGWLHVALAEVRIGDPDVAGRALEQARQGFAAQQDNGGLVWCDEVRAIALRRGGDYEASARLQADLDQRPLRPQQALYRFVAHNSRAITARLLGDADATLRHLHAASEAASATGWSGPRITALSNLGGFHQDVYNLDDARRLSEEAFAAARAVQAGSALTTAATNLIIIYYASGEPRLARTMVEFLLGHARELAPGALRRYALPLALGHLGVGEIDEALKLLEADEVAAVSDGDGMSPPGRHRPEVDVLRQATDSPLGLSVSGLSPKCEYRSAKHEGAAMSMWAWIKSRCLLAQGDAAQARAVADHTLKQRRERGLADQPYDTMELHKVLADACEQLGDHRAALQCMREAHGLYEQLVGRSARARYVSLEIGHQLGAAQRERDMALDSRRSADDDRLRLRELNAALRAQVEQTEMLHARLREQALNDPLTGLHNRRYLFEVAPGLLDLSRRQGKPLCVVLIDLDHFKLLNDTFGHQTGDQVLQRFAKLLSEMLRSSDIVCRHGGEEFVALMPDIDGDGAQAMLARLLEAFQALPAENASRRRTPAGSFSAGIALFPRHGNTLEQLLSRADRALYSAKHQGRARIEQAPGSNFGPLI